MKKMASDLITIEASVEFVNAGKSTGRIRRAGWNCRVKCVLLCIGLAAALFATSLSQGTLVTYDGFNYTPTGPSTIDNQSGGIGWDANWGQFLGGATSYIITNGSLSDPSATLYTNSNRVYSAGG